MYWYIWCDQVPKRDNPCGCGLLTDHGCSGLRAAPPRKRASSLNRTPPDQKQPTWATPDRAESYLVGGRRLRRASRGHALLALLSSVFLFLFLFLFEWPFSLIRCVRRRRPSAGPRGGACVSTMGPRSWRARPNKSKKLGGTAVTASRGSHYQQHAADILHAAHRVLSLDKIYDMNSLCMKHQAKGTQKGLV